MELVHKSFGASTAIEDSVMARRRRALTDGFKKNLKFDQSEDPLN